MAVEQAFVEMVRSNLCLFRLGRGPNGHIPISPPLKISKTCQHVGPSVTLIQGMSQICHTLLTLYKSEVFVDGRRDYVPERAKDAFHHERLLSRF